MSPAATVILMLLPFGAAASSGPEVTLDTLHGGSATQAAISQTIYDPLTPMPDECLLPHDLPAVEAAVVRLSCIVQTAPVSGN